jgi:hypothetical protein
MFTHREGYRKLLKFVVEDLETGKSQEVYLDSFAIWQDLGSGYLQPTRSTQGVPGIYNLKAGQAIRTMGYRYKRLDDQVYNFSTSMNKYSFSQQGTLFRPARRPFRP